MKKIFMEEISMRNFYERVCMGGNFSMKEDFFMAEDFFM